MAETVFKKYSGNLVDSMNLTGFANMQNKIMLDHMHLGELDQYRRWAFLDTDVSVVSNNVFGKSTISITAPVEREQPVKITSTLLVKNRKILFGFWLRDRICFRDDALADEFEQSAVCAPINGEVAYFDDDIYCIVNYTMGSKSLMCYDYSDAQKYNKPLPDAVIYVSCIPTRYAYVRYEDFGYGVYLYDVDDTQILNVPYSGNYYIPCAWLSSKALYICVNDMSVVSNKTYIEKYDTDGSYIGATDEYETDDIAQQVAASDTVCACLYQSGVVRIYSADLEYLASYSGPGEFPGIYQLVGNIDNDIYIWKCEYSSGIYIAVLSTVSKDGKLIYASPEVQYSSCQYTSYVNELSVGYSEVPNE